MEDEKLKKVLPYVLGVCALGWVALKFLAPDGTEAPAVPTEFAMQSAAQDEFSQAPPRQQQSAAISPVTATPSSQPTPGASSEPWPAHSIPPGQNADVPNPPQSVSQFSIQEAAKLRDPFKRPAAEQIAAGPKTELEKFPLGDFKLVGLMTGTASPRAMLAGPDSKSHVVREGMKIGVRSGVIREISNKGVTVREKIVSPLGTEENIDVVLTVGGETVEKSAANTH